MAIYERQPDGSYAPQEVLSTTKTDNFTITYGPVEGLDGERLQLAKAFLKDIAEHNLRITSLEVNAGISGADDEIADIFEVPEGIKNSVDTNNTTSVWVSNKMYRNDYMFSQWDITSATYINSFYVGNQDGYPFGLFFKPDGTTMYIIGTNNDKVYRYDLSTPWDITTATYINSFYVGSQDGYPQGLFFKSDGSVMYVIGNANDKVYRYNLSTPWDITTATYINSFDISSQDSIPTGLYFKSDGTIMYVAGNAHDKVYRYDLSTPWDITTATYINSFYVGSQESCLQGVFFKPDGTTMYIIGTNNGKVYKYDISFVQTTPQEKQLWIKYDKPKPQAVYLALYSGAFQEDEIGDVYFYFTDGTNNSILMNPWTIYSNLNLSFTPTHVVIVQKDTTVSKISKYVLLIAY